MDTPLEGRRIPDVQFDVLDRGTVKQVTSRELFSGQTVVLFALPGAFTPTCSNRHVPRYQELAGPLKAAGVDEIVCVSVNDPWVMDAWAREQHAPDVRFIPDTNGEFTRALGMLVEKPGLGPRSRRYSLLVRHGTIEKAFVEPEQEGDPYLVSDADTMLRYLDPRAPALTPVAVLARAGCPFCERALRMLREHGIPFETVPVNGTVSMQAVLAISGASTVPQVFIGGQHIGGSEELQRYLASQRTTERAA